jgi:hypothetical protein
LAPSFSASWRRKAANSAVQEFFAPVVEAAYAEVEQPMPEPTDELYAEFSRTGNRLLFEERYFERRRRFSRAAMAILLDQDHGSAIRRSLVDKLTSIFQEESWALPAHVIPSSGKNSMEIDLFAAETANMMAEALDLFGGIIPTDLAGGIRERLKRTIFENYIDNHLLIPFTTTTNNWNGVCHQGVLGAALAVETDTDVLARMLAIAARSLPIFLNDFGIDGGSSEGPGYWAYGFGWLDVLNGQLETATRSALSLFEGDPHIDQIAMFGTRMSLSNGYCVNFADASAQYEINPRLLTYLGDRLRIDALRKAGAAAYSSLAKNGIGLHAHGADLFYFGRLMRDWPAGLLDIDPPAAGDFYFRDLDVLVAHRRDSQGRLWEFGAKGGHNDEAHNHNDAGSYLVNIDGVPLVVEIGAPEYTKDYFLAGRYQYLAARSLGHSVPLVNGVEQAGGAKFAAVVKERELTTDTVRFVVDLTACYPPEARLARLMRSIEYDVNGSLTVRDAYALDGAATRIETAIITRGEVTRKGGEAAIALEGRRLRVTPGSGTVIREVEEHGYSDPQGAAQTVLRIVLEAAEPAASGVLEYDLRAD